MADILALGIDADHEQVDSVPFDAPASLADYPVAAIDPAVVPALWSHVPPGSDGKYTTNAETDGGFGRGLVELLRRRRREVSALLAAGGTVLSFLRPVGTPLYVRRRTRRGPAAVIVHAYSWMPETPALAKLVIAGAPGREPRPADPDHAAWRLIHDQGQAAAFEACVANEQLHRSWHVVATDRLGRPVAFEVPVGAGRLVFVPPVAADAGRCGALLAWHFGPEPQPEAEPEREPEPEPAEPTPPPDWLTDHMLPGQAEAHERFVQLTERLAELRAELESIRDRNAELAALAKLLYAASAPELAGAAAVAFRRLGFAVQPQEDGCLALEAEEGRALVALAASEAAIESDPYWVLVRRFEDESEPPAGIIVGNAWRARPPGEREAPFSDLLRRGAEHRGLCLLATTELHAALAAVITRPDDAALRHALRQALLDGIGPCTLRPLLDGGDSG